MALVLFDTSVRLPPDISCGSWATRQVDEGKTTEKARGMFGQRLFVGGLILMGVFALGHLGGFLRAAHAARHDPSLADLTEAMRKRKTKYLGFEPSILDFREYFSLNFSILLLLACGLGFAMLAAIPDRSATIRVLSPFYGGAMLLLLATSVRFSVVQGIITCPAIAILFGLAWWFA